MKKEIEEDGCENLLAGLEGSDYEDGYNQAIKDILKILDDLENPYPEDIFPKLTKLELDKINALLESVLKFPLDRLSAELMRRARNNLIEELKKKLEQNETK